MRDAGYSVAQSEAAVRDAVRDALIFDPRVEASQVRIEIVAPIIKTDPVKVKSVILTGNVDSPSAKQAAEEDARNTVGVSSVKNHLTFTEPVVSDSQILDMVKKALIEDPYLKTFQLKTSIINGRVTLTGKVPSHKDKQHAGDIVSRIEGVVDVQNDVKVESK
jgi:hyperosmotically inducible protein